MLTNKKNVNYIVVPRKKPPYFTYSLGIVVDLFCRGFGNPRQKKIPLVCVKELSSFFPCISHR